VLITHGNAGCALDRGYLAGPIHEAAPIDVYILEYPGYGARAGSPDKSSLLAAGEEALGLLTNGLPCYLVGECQRAVKTSQSRANENQPL
jgi:uncharacterized protein